MNDKYIKQFFVLTEQNIMGTHALLSESQLTTNRWHQWRWLCLLTFLVLSTAGIRCFLHYHHSPIVSVVPAVSQLSHAPLNSSLAIFKNDIKNVVVANEVKQSRTEFQLGIDLDCFANARKDGSLIDFIKMAKLELKKNQENTPNRISTIPNLRVAATRQLLHDVMLRKADLALIHENNEAELISSMPVMDKVLVVPKSFG